MRAVCGHSLERHASFVIFFITYFFGFGEFSNQQLFDGELKGVNLVLKLTSFVGSDAGSDHWPGDTAGTAQSRLGRDEHIGDILQQLAGWRGDVSFLDSF